MPQTGKKVIVFTPCLSEHKLKKKKMKQIWNYFVSHEEIKIYRPQWAKHEPLLSQSVILLAVCLTYWFTFKQIGPTFGVLTSSTVKFCSRGHAVWGNVKASEEAWGTAGERSRRTPCGSRLACAEPLVDCRDEGNRRVFAWHQITSFSP